MDEPRGFRFYVQGDDEANGSVSLETFARMLFETVGAMTEAAADLADDGQRVVWRITELHEGSATLAARADIRNDHQDYVAGEASRIVVNAMNRGMNGDDFGAFLAPDVATHMRNLFRVIAREKFDLLSVSNGDVEAEIRPALLRLPVAQRPLRFSTSTSIDGRVVAVSFAQNQVLSLRSPLYKELIPCYFNVGLVQVVRHSLLRRVSLFGDLHQDEDGRPSTMTGIRRIEFFPSDEDLPFPDDIAGSDPNLTDGLPAEVWMRRQRDERA